MGNPHTILLNGRRYDALTGRLIKDSEDNKSSKNKKAHHSEKSGPIDDFFRSSTKQLKTNIVTPVKVKVNYNLNKTKHKVAPHAKRITQHSKTLMRNTVKKPDIAPHKSKSHTRRHLQRANYNISNRIAPARQTIVNHAETIKQSDFVKKFNELTTPANPVKPNPNEVQTTANSEVHLKKLEQLAAIEANPADDAIFTEAALKLADSHQPIKRNQIRFYERIADRFKIGVKTLFIITVATVVLLSAIVLGIIFQNNVQIYIADTRTGTHGILPTSIPSGFGVSNISYTKNSQTGSVRISYKSHSDNRNFDILETSSNLDSQALASSVVQPAVGASYQTYQVAGRTVYVYNHNAVWVAGGIYYKLTNNAKLTNDQIVQIASTT